MDDNAVVNANHKKNEPFAVGTHIEYEITRPEYNGGKVSKPQDQPQPSPTASPQITPQPQQYKQDPAKARSIEMQVCLKESNTFHSIHGFITDDPYARKKEVCDTAEIMYESLFKTD